MDQVRERGLGFTPDPTFLEALAHAHTSTASIDMIKSVKPRSHSKDSSDRERAYQILLGAVQNIETRDYVSATQKYQQALLLAPESATLHLAYAGDLIRLQRYPDAEVEARRSLELWPDNAEAHATLATALIANIHEAEAVSEARKVLRIYPDHKAGLIMLSMALTRNSQYKEAIPVLRDAISRTPELPSIRKDLGVCLVHTGDLSEAVQELDNYLNQDPNDADAHYHLGVALRAQGRHDDAILQFREAAQLAPDSPIIAAAANDDVLSPSVNPSAGTQPDDGSVSGNAYTNKFFGFSIQFPQGWVVLNQEQTRGMLSLGSAIVQSGDPTGPDVTAASRSLMIPLLFVTRGSSGGQSVKTDVFEVFAVDLRTQKTHWSAMDFATQIGSVFRTLGVPMNETGAPTNADIDGREFVKFDSTLGVNSDVGHMTDYAIITKEFILTFQMLSLDPDELQKLGSTMNTLHFTQPIE
jgi:Flp pilus assembly protein TadD